MIPGKLHGSEPKGNLWIHGTVNHQEANWHLKIYTLHIKTQELKKFFLKNNYLKYFKYILKYDFFLKRMICLYICSQA